MKEKVGEKSRPVVQRRAFLTFSFPSPDGRGDNKEERDEPAKEEKETSADRRADSFFCFAGHLSFFQAPLVTNLAIEFIAKCDQLVVPASACALGKR